MRQSRKLMMGVCGLALSSLFVVGNKSVVHADSVSDAQNNAITWDSDNDDSQVVKNEQQQDNAIQSVQTQGSAQQKQVETLNTSSLSQSIQAGVQNQTDDVNAQSINTKMNSVNDAVQQKSVQNNNALSTGDTQSVDSRVLKDLDSNETTVSNNYYNAESREDINNNVNNTVNNTHNNAVKVSNVNGSFKSIPVHISHPSSNRIYVNFVNTNGQSVGQGNYWINLSTSSNGTYQIPSGYQLASGNGKYSVEDNATSKRVAKIRKYEGNWRDTSFTPEEIQYIQNHCTDGPVDDMDFVVSSKTTAMICAHNGYLTEEAMSGRANPESQRIINKLASYVPRPTNKTAARGAGNQGEILITNETVHHYTFNDNSGSVLSNSRNRVNVVLTKPQHVDPATNSRLNAEATRTIKINFPDGQVPKSYDGIVDKSGKLVQTVHFTRTATEDALTGNILQYGNWTSDNQDHNFIGFEARTLPRIPGYTLSIKPA